MKRQFIKLVLDVGKFDERPYADHLAACHNQGIEFTNLYELGDTEANRVRLYELNKLCSQDIPGRGEFFSYQEFAARRYGSHYDPKGVVIAIANKHWIGMCATSKHVDKGFCFNEMTGVLSEYRRRGLALALKTMSIRYVKSTGLRKVFTIQDRENTSAINMNRKLGYEDDDHT